VPRVAIACVTLMWLGCAPLAEAPAPSAAARTSSPSLYDQPWVWNDEQGASVQLSRWRGVPLVVTMIYTSCTSTCPVTIDRLLRLADRFQHEGRAAEFVLVTLDPAGDTLEKLRSFRAARQLPARWHLLRGNDEETQDLADFLGIKVMDDGSHILHDGTIALFDLAGRLTERSGS
jgi:protein SCO1/2